MQKKCAVKVQPSTWLKRSGRTLRERCRNKCVQRTMNWSNVMRRWPEFLQNHERDWWWAENSYFNSLISWWIIGMYNRHHKLFFFFFYFWKTKNVSHFTATDNVAICFHLLKEGLLVAGGVTMWQIPTVSFYYQPPPLNKCVWLLHFVLVRAGVVCDVHHVPQGLWSS